MMIVQAREQRATACVDRRLAGCARERRADLRDAAGGDAHVAPCAAADFGAADQHSSARSDSLSAPGGRA